MTLRVLFEHEEWLAFDKPDGLATITERDRSIETLHSIAQAELGRRLWIVHRLDKEVSGVILFAKSPDAHRALSMSFETREVKKIYRAIVHGSVRDERQTIDAPIHQFGSGRMGVDPRGKASVTEVVKLESSPKYSSLEVSPQTGRRHQIRVHLYSLGHPIVGDLKYGERSAQTQPTRLYLHSHRLSFVFKGAPYAIESPVPWLGETRATLGVD